MSVAYACLRSDK